MNVNDPVMVVSEKDGATACGNVISFNPTMVTIDVKHNVNISGIITLPLGQHAFCIECVKPLTSFQPGDEVEIYDYESLVAKGTFFAKGYTSFHSAVKVKEILSVPDTLKHWAFFVGKVIDILTMRLKNNTNITTPKVCTCNLWAGCTCGVFKEEMKNKEVLSWT